MPIIFGNGQDGTVTISSNTDVGSANFKQYENLTVNNSIVLSGNLRFAIFVRGTLSLSGTISSNQQGTAGGSVYVFARVASGSGTIRANASGSGGGSAPSIEGVTSPAEATDGIDSTDSNALTGSAAGGVYNIDEAARRIRSLLSIGQVCGYFVHGGEGAEGGTDFTSGASPNGAGGGGGGSFIDAGGESGGGGDAVPGGSTGTATSGAGGDGGSAGGLVLIASFSIIEYTIESKGSNGANGANATATDDVAAGGGGGGGGGAGGLVCLIAPRFEGSADVSEGSGGTGGNGVNSGDDGSDGSDGTHGRLFLWDIRAIG